jgi:hypothetical protein
MGMLGDLLAQAGGNIDIGALAGKAGLDAGQVQSALGDLLPQIADPGVDNGSAIAAVAGKTGLDAGALGALLPQILGAVQGAGGQGGVLEQVMAGLGGNASGAGGVLGQIAGALDRDGDGNPIDDIMGMFGKK